MATTAESREAREQREEREEFERKTARALGNRHRVRIMELLNEEDASPADLSRKVGLPTSNLNYHFGVLEECGFIEFVKSVPTNRTKKKVYRSLRPALFADLAWATLSPHLRAEISLTMLRNILRRLGDALETSTFDAKDDRHLSLQTVSVDWCGWDSLRALLAETLDKVDEIEAESAARCSEAERFPATVTLLGYESPRMYEKSSDA